MAGLDVEVPGTPVTVVGRVVDFATALPIAGVTVTAPDAQPATTDADGSFSLEAMSRDGLAVRATMDGYTASLVRVSAAEAASEALPPSVRIALKAVAATAQLDAAEGGTISDASGAQVTFPANAFVTKDGQPVSGEVTVTITPINPYDPADLQAFPGGFEAINAEGEPGTLFSFAVLDITATADGVDLTLAEGKSATVFFPLPEDLDAPESVPLWSLDETSGIWKEEGTATRRALEGKRYYEAQIPHLSWWNCDGYNGATVEVRGTITTDDPDLAAAMSAGVTTFAEAKSLNFVATHSGCGGSLSFSGQVPANDFVSLQVVGYTGSRENPFSANANFFLTPASGVVELGNIVVSRDSCVLGWSPLGLTFSSKANCNGHCMKMPTFCVPGLDPIHPCSTNNGGCLNGRECIEFPVTAADEATLWFCGNCPSFKVPMGLLDCQGVSCSISRGFCDDNATCQNASPAVICTCNSGYFGSGTSCRAWSTCGAGKHVAAQGTATTDRTCTACEDGTFSATNNAQSCSAWSECSQNQNQAQAGTASTDRVCEDCDQGYQGNGEACVPACIDAVCDPNATCTEPETCTCNEGYKGDGSSCQPLVPTNVDIAAGLTTGNTTWTSASTDTVRGVEFYLATPATLTSVTVNGLPPDMADTARIWVKTGAVNRQATDTFPLGSPYGPTATTASSATFELPTALALAKNTYSIVVSVADTEQGFQWEVLQFYNNSPSVTVDAITLQSVWGWRGNVNVDTNTATDVTIYDAYMIQIPKVTLTFTD